ncbi:MAG TPA: C4-type zinc ribbon domain-containing protein [Bacteroidota bacterium]
MENRLRLLFALQRVDSNYDELQELKGDLPELVKDLQEKIKEQENLRKDLEDTIKHSLVSRDEADSEIVSLKEKIEKYKAQQFEVKSNKQYDALGREIDYSQGRITKLTRELEQLEGKAGSAKEDVQKVGPELERLQAELKEKSDDLALVNKEHEEEELKLRHERDKLVARIQKSDLQMYERIRKAKGGLAVVPVRRNACGGCYNRVPPQRVLELRKNSHMTTCERCGRILVSEELANDTSEIL